MNYYTLKRVRRLRDERVSVSVRASASEFDCVELVAPLDCDANGKPQYNVIAKLSYADGKRLLYDLADEYGAIIRE